MGLCRYLYNPNRMFLCTEHDPMCLYTSNIIMPHTSLTPLPPNLIRILVDREMISPEYEMIHVTTQISARAVSSAGAGPRSSVRSIYVSMIPWNTHLSCLGQNAALIHYMLASGHAT